LWLPDSQPKMASACGTAAFVLILLGAAPRPDDDEVTDFRNEVRRGDRTRMPGAVRASAGINTTEADISRLISAVARIAGGAQRLSPTSRIRERETSSPTVLLRRGKQTRGSTDPRACLASAASSLRMLREQGTNHPGQRDRRRRSTLANDNWLESAKTDRNMVQAVVNSSRGTEGVRGARQLLSPVRPSRYRMV